MQHNPTIRINDVGGAFPEITAVQDVGTSLDITNLDDFDIGLLANHKKMGGTPPRSTSPINIMDSGNNMKSSANMNNDIEFVNLDDTGVTYDVKPPANMGDTIRILRDGPSARPIDSGMPSLTLNSGNNVTMPVSSAPAAAAAPAPSTWFSGIPVIGATADKIAGSASGGGGFRSWFGGAAKDAVAATEPVSTYMTPEQEAVKKTEGLTLLERMDRKGVGGTKMTMANTMDEINAEVARRKDSKGLEASIRFQRSMMTTVTSGMEFLNNRYDPLGLSLDGWSEQVNENSEDYDEIFEELYDKYKDKSKVAPEVRLVMSLGLSAAMCHITNTMFKSRMPGMDDIMRKNPDLARQMAQAAAQHAVGPGFANFVGLGMGGGGRPVPQQYHGPPTPQNEMMHESPQQMSYAAPMGSGMGAAIPTRDPRGAPTGVPTARREMQGPSGVDDILRTLSAAGDASQRTAPTPAFDAEDIGSVGSGLTTETMRRNGLTRRRKITTVQPTGATLTLNV